MLTSSENIGFGFTPSESQNHFVVLIPRSKQQEVKIFELLHFDEELNEEGLDQRFIGQESLGKVRLSHKRWGAIQGALRTEFSRRVREQGQRKRPAWQVGINRLHRHFGKELTILAWAIEEVAGDRLELAVHNWLALRPEERWWLYTMTNASAGHPERGRGVGWRRALRYALAESPAKAHQLRSTIDDVAERNQMLFEPDAKAPAG